jgi:hypothetical protein
MSREELIASILGNLTPAAPQTPQDPGPNATPAQREIFEAQKRDGAVLATLSKPIDQISTDERAQLLKQVRDCAERGWQ